MGRDDACGGPPNPVACRVRWTRYKTGSLLFRWHFLFFNAVFLFCLVYCCPCDVWVLKLFPAPLLLEEVEPNNVWVPLKLYTVALLLSLLLVHLFLLLFNCGFSCCCPLLVLVFVVLSCWCFSSLLLLLARRVEGRPFVYLLLYSIFVCVVHFQSCEAACAA